MAATFFALPVRDLEPLEGRPRHAAVPCTRRASRPSIVGCGSGACCRCGHFPFSSSTGRGGGNGPGDVHVAVACLCESVRGQLPASSDAESSYDDADTAGPWTEHSCLKLMPAGTGSLRQPFRLRALPAADAHTLTGKAPYWSARASSRRPAAAEPLPSPFGARKQPLSTGARSALISDGRWKIR